LVVRRLRIGIDVICGPPVAAVAGPKAAAADLVRIGLPHDPTPDIRSISCGRRRATTRKAGDRQIETTPEEMHRTDLSEKARTKRLHHPVALQQYTPESLGVDRIVMSMGAILIKGDRIADLARHRPNMNGDV